MKRKVWDITVKDNPNRVVMGENDEFYTTDTEAYLVFNLEDKNFNPATAVLTLENRNDGSLKNETVDVVDGLIEWEMPQRYIEHFGNWQGQLVYEDTKDGQPELYTSAPFSFVVNAHIGDKKKPSLVEIENWEKFIREGTELIETWEDLEALREENERQRQANYQELLDTGVLQTNINNKLAEAEQEYAPRLTELEQNDENLTAQLAQTENRMNGISINPMFPPVPFRPIVSDGNFYDAENFKYYKDKEMTIPATDNRGLIQGLVDYLDDNGGGTIILPIGNFVVRGPIEWKSKVSLIGASKVNTRLYAEGELFSVIKDTNGMHNGTDADDPSVWLEDCTFANFLIDNKGLSYTSPSVEGKAMFIIYMRRALFRDLILLNSIGTALGCDFLVDSVIENIFTDNAGRNAPEGSNWGGNSGIGIGTGAFSEEPLVISNCFTYNSGNYGVFVEVQVNPNNIQAKQVKIVNCHAMGNYLGFGNKGSGQTQFIGCTAYNNYLHGFHLTQRAYGDQLIGCIAENNGGDGVRIENSYRGKLELSNVRANNNGGTGIRAMPNIDKMKHVRLSQIQAHGNGLNGVWFGGGVTNLKLNDIDVLNNGQKSPTYNRGIELEGVIDIVNIVDVVAYDDQDVKTQLVGIEIHKDVTNYLIDDINVVGYSQSNGLMLHAPLESGVLGLTNGMKTKVSGSATIPDGDDKVDITHNLGYIPRKVMIIPKSTDPLYLRLKDYGRVRIGRSGTSGITDFDYYIEI